MKEASIGEPDVYLVRKVRKVRKVELDTWEVYWAFSSLQYVQEACKNVHSHLKLRNGENKLQDCKYFLPKKDPVPW